MSNVKQLSVTELNDLILANEKILLIDIREKDECNNYIYGAHFYPYSEYSYEKMSSMFKSNQKIIIYCKVGKRSALICQKILQNNPKINVYNLEGGIVEWSNKGYELIEKKDNDVCINQKNNLKSCTKNDKNCHCSSMKLNIKNMSVERQVKIVTGTLIFVFYLLGEYSIAGYLGLAMIFSGLLDICFIAKLLNKIKEHYKE